MKLQIRWSFRLDLAGLKLSKHYTLFTDLNLLINDTQNSTQTSSWSTFLYYISFLIYNDYTILFQTHS